MSHSLSFSKLARAIRTACYCEENNVSTSEGLEHAAGSQAHTVARHASRREFLANSGKLAVVGAMGSVVPPLRLGLTAPPPSPGLRVAVVGEASPAAVFGDRQTCHGSRWGYRCRIGFDWRSRLRTEVNRHLS